MSYHITNQYYPHIEMIGTCEFEEEENRQYCSQALVFILDLYNI